jgi:hypothetical protein
LFQVIFGSEPRSLAAIAAQHPRQIPFIRSFISASSALIASLPFSLSTAEVGGAGFTSLAAAAEAGFPRS